MCARKATWARHHLDVLDAEQELLTARADSAIGSHRYVGVYQLLSTMGH